MGWDEYITRKITIQIQTTTNLLAKSEKLWKLQSGLFFFACDLYLLFVIQGNFKSHLKKSLPPKKPI